MEWQVIVALIVAAPVVLLPVVFIWSINIRGMYLAMREARHRRKEAARLLRVAEEPIQK